MVLIQNYRGFNISFEPENESFFCEIDQDKKYTKQSFAASKKFIDDYIKENGAFAPFVVVDRHTGSKLNIVGIRKDNRFISIDYKGKKDQVSDYDLSNFILYNGKEHDLFFAELAALDAERQRAYDRLKEKEGQIKGMTLKEYKANLLKS